jgi:DNA polymerase-1
MDDLYTFIGLDYGQIEVRVVAQVSGDKQLIQDCLESDIHTTVGVTMTGWSPDQIRNDKKIRTLTKNIHFGIIFGQSEDGTVNYVRAVTPPEDLEKISEEMIREGFRRYHARYPGIRRLIDKQRAIAKEHKFVETIFGLRRPLIIEENSRNTAEDVIDVDEDEDEFFEEETSGKRKSYWGNICINSRIQGSAHQLMICAIVNLLRQAEKYKVLGVPSLEVHDFLGFRVRVLDLIEAYKQSRYLLEHESLNTVKKDFPHIKWRVPIVTEAEAGFRLGCQVGLEEGFSIGDWLIRWFLKAKKQEVELDKELKTIQAEAIAC